MERSGRENGLPELEAGHLWNSEEGEVVSFACDDSEDTLIPGGSRQWGCSTFLREQLILREYPLSYPSYFGLSQGAALSWCLEVSHISSF